MYIVWYSDSCSVFLHKIILNMGILLTMSMHELNALLFSKKKLWSDITPFLEMADQTNLDGDMGPNETVNSMYRSHDSFNIDQFWVSVKMYLFESFCFMKNRKFCMNY